VRTLLLAPVASYLYAAVAVALYLAGRVVFDGWRQVNAERRHPLRALARICERRNW
jgi:hypothetical protein